MFLINSFILDEAGEGGEEGPYDFFFITESYTPPDQDAVDFDFEG